MPNLERFEKDFVTFREISGQKFMPRESGFYSKKSRALWDQTVRNDNSTCFGDVLVVNQAKGLVDVGCAMEIIINERLKFARNFYNLIVPPSTTVFLGTNKFTHNEYKNYGNPPPDALALGGYNSCCLNVDIFQNKDLSKISPERRVVIHEPGHCWWRWALGLASNSTTADEMLAGPRSINEWEDVPNQSFSQPPGLDTDFYGWYKINKNTELNYFQQPAVKFALKYYSSKKPVAEYFSS
jgi:hypothetical protein